MSEYKIYLTVDRQKRQPQNDGYIAVITQGQPQFGDKNCTVLDIEIVKNMKAAKAWYKKMMIEKPWEARN